MNQNKKNFLRRRRRFSGTEFADPAWTQDGTVSGPSIVSLPVPSTPAGWKWTFWLRERGWDCFFVLYRAHRPSYLPRREQLGSRRSKTSCRRAIHRRTSIRGCNIGRPGRHRSSSRRSKLLPANKFWFQHRHQSAPKSVMYTGHGTHGSTRIVAISVRKRNWKSCPTRWETWREVSSNKNPFFKS